MNYINMLDENLMLWNKFRQGDADAFGALIKTHYNDLFHYGNKLVRDEELVKDAIQDMFLVLWEKRESINETSFVKFYLVKSLRRRLLKSVEKKRYFNIGNESYFKGFFSKELDNVNVQMVKENLTELSGKIKSVLACLPVRQQEVIYFRFYMDADIDEIAEIMEMNTQSVYNLLHRSLKKLKKVTSHKPFSPYYFLHFLSGVLLFF